MNPVDRSRDFAFGAWAHKGAYAPMHETPPFSPSTPPRAIFTVRQFSERHPAFIQTALRRFIYYRVPRRVNVGGRIVDFPANGFEHALVRVGRRVLIDEAKFFDWIDSQQRREGGAA